ncbi:MAG: hypothetical protein JO337_06260, partial [Acidimicrobiales bacterium]|nr:hypothetical protein [Acidimicrobiales bacterium]
GWSPIGLGPAEYAIGLGRIQAGALASSRQPSDIVAALQLSVWIGVVPEGVRPDLAGSPDGVAESLGAYGRVGVEHIVLQIDATPTDTIDQLGLFSREIMPRM